MSLLEQKLRCGDANKKGNIELFYKGGCKQELKLEDAYRCTGCGGYFHLDCIKKHFELEKEHDVGRNNLRNEIISKIEDLDSDGEYCCDECTQSIIKTIKKL